MRTQEILVKFVLPIISYLFAAYIDLAIGYLVEPLPFNYQFVIMIAPFMVVIFVWHFQIVESIFRVITSRDQGE